MTSARIAKAIMMNREGTIRIDGGYDGVYGKAHLEDEGDGEEKEEGMPAPKSRQAGLGEWQ